MLAIFRQADTLCEHKLPTALVVHFDGGASVICVACSQERTIRATCRLLGKLNFKPQNLCAWAVVCLLPEHLQAPCMRDNKLKAVAMSDQPLLST